MATIDEIILSSINPFDSNTKSTNFWYEKQAANSTVESIHTDIIAQVEESLAQVIHDQSIRTILLLGDSGSGKTYLLGRIKKKLNSKAFFVYVEPFTNSDHFWRHLLRETVNSLLQIPEGEKESQLILWLKGLFKVEKVSIKEKILKKPVWELFQSDTKKAKAEFIKKLQDLFKQAGIFNADEFFGVLCNLNDPDLYDIAANWLKGDSLHEDSQKALKVKNSIEDEDTAKKILANFGRISAETQPIVLCFDQLESISKLPDGSIDLPILFTANTLIHSSFKNFLVIVSFTTDTWQNSNRTAQGSDLARIDRQIKLPPITLEQAEAVFSIRLHSLYRQADPQPTSPIYPITREHLQEKFPRGRTQIRSALAVGKDIYQTYKQYLIDGKKDEFTVEPIKEVKEKDPSIRLAALQLRWADELKLVQTEVKNIEQFDTLILLEMLQTAIRALLGLQIQPNLINGSVYAGNSFSFYPNQSSDKSNLVGVIWSEHNNMNAFCNIMKACQKLASKTPDLNLRLIRLANLGNPSNKGYKLSQEIFYGNSNHHHKHIKPDLNSIHYLRTFYNLVKDAREGDLTIGNEILALKDLEALVRESKSLEDCKLLKELDVIPSLEADIGKVAGTDKGRVIPPPPDLTDIVAKFSLNLLKQNHVIGLNLIIQKNLEHFSTQKVDRSQIEAALQKLYDAKEIQILNPTAPNESQLICLVPKSK